MVFLAGGTGQLRELNTLMKRRAKAFITGIVQGVGFRPFVYNLALRHGLSGYVLNTTMGVDLEVEGKDTALESFFKEISQNPPPLAHISDLAWAYVAKKNDQYFVIRDSNASTEKSALISPDVCVCEDCLSEMRDPGNRRYRYPFINCTNCGPRYTIIKDIPYDRGNTTMADFHMCPACLEEYNNPEDRRFHAQPNACRECGPTVSLHDCHGVRLDVEDPINKTIELLGQGKILAVKGLGGFHLAVDADNHRSVQRLRRRKNREEKPFAIMVKDLDAADKITFLQQEEAHILLSRQRPIVLAKKRKDHGLSPGVAPKNSHFGIMLPYTPLHHLLMDNKLLRALVMTSGNRTEEPITINNDDALKNLSGIADFFLLHNRDIHLRSDDSVVRVFMGEPQHIRRSRGYVPIPVFLAPETASSPSSLGLGGELKNTICLFKQGRALMSQHIGDMENLETLEFFKLTIEHLERTLEIRPEVAVHDLHPNYLSTRYARSIEGMPVFPVQHHHAHVIACMAENGCLEPVIGVTLDGTGYGTDRTVWGGEILLADVTSFRRIGHLEPVPLPGGDSAARSPWRMAVAYLSKAFGDGFFNLDIPFIKKLDRGKTETIIRMSERRINSPLTSSCGRLFDAVAALIGIRNTIAYEGQAAIELEMRQNRAPCKGYHWSVREDGDCMVLETSDIIRGIVTDIIEGLGPACISAKFHKTMIMMLGDALKKAKAISGLSTVVLSGGCFQNLVLLKGMMDLLGGMGFRVLCHRKVPTNDAGISLGQAIFGAFTLKGYKSTL